MAKKIFLAAGRGIERRSSARLEGILTTILPRITILRMGNMFLL